MVTHFDHPSSFSYRAILPRLVAGNGVGSQNHILLSWLDMYEVLEAGDLATRKLEVQYMYIYYINGTI